MKTLFLIALFSVTACQAKEKPATNTTVTETKTKTTAPKAEEDCDDKAAAAKKVEIKEDSINLLNNTAGCTLE